MPPALMSTPACPQPITLPLLPPASSSAAALSLLSQGASRCPGANVSVQGDDAVSGFVRLAAMSTLGWRNLVRN